MASTNVALGPPRRRWWWLAPALVIVGFVTGPAGAAWAQGEDGPTPPVEADPFGSNIAPHGGYSTSTNFCGECHAVHGAPNSNALLFRENVTAVCGTCHMVYAISCMECHFQGGGYPPRHTSDGPGIVATTSNRSVYHGYAYGGTPGSAHGLGADAPPDDPARLMTSSDWDAEEGRPTTDATTPAGPGTAWTDDGGLYCGSCHTPHGSFGQVVNNWTDADEGRTIFWSDPAGVDSGPRQLHRDAASGAWQVCLPGGVDCRWAQVQDVRDQLVSLFGYKILSASPNHSWSQVQSYRTEEYNLDGQGWCGACHAAQLGDGNHVHPTGCNACHGNPADGSSVDWPHTSTNPALLVDYPDALCLTCHSELP